MEIAGVILSAVPLCVAILDGWSNAEEKVASLRAYSPRILRYKRMLEGHQRDLESLLRMILHGSVADLALDRANLYKLLDDDWKDVQHREMAAALREKHGPLYLDFKELIQDSCAELKLIVHRLGLISSQRELSNNDLVQLLKDSRQRQQQQNSVMFLVRLRFAIRDKSIEKSFDTLATRINTLRTRIKDNITWRRIDEAASESAASAYATRTKKQLRALYRSLDKATRTGRAHGPLEIALGLVSRSGREGRESTARKKYTMALSNRASWQRAVVHVSDANGRHELQSTPRVVSDLNDLWPYIAPSPRLVPCLELHLDLDANDRLSGPYETSYSRQFTLSDSKPELASLAQLVGSNVMLLRRLELATMVSGAVQFLFDTPFLDGICTKEDLGFLIKPGQTIGDVTENCPLYLRREFAAVRAAASNARTTQSPQAVLLMLGIVLLELYLDKACQYNWSGQPSLKDLQDSLFSWHAQVSATLPQRYDRAINACVYVGSAPAYLANRSTREIDEIAENILMVYGREKA